MKVSMSTRTVSWIVAAITLLSLFLNSILLSRQPVSLDDFHVALSAINFTESGQLGPTMWNHPCLRNILVYGFLRLFGTGVLGVKGVSLLLGTLCTPLMALVARRIFRDERIALIAAMLWAVDPLVIDFSRQGINDIYLAFFPLLGIYLAYRFRESHNSAWLLGSGVSFGMGLASKWSALFPLTVTILLLFIAIRKGPGGMRDRIARYGHLFALLLVVPALIYLLTFAPWFGRGYSMAEWPALQRSMFLETSQHTGYKQKLWDDSDNRAWKWFIVPSVFVDPFMNLDPPWGDDQGITTPDQHVTVVLGVANPLVWLLTFPALFFLLRRALRDRDEGCRYLAGLFILSYLPLVVSPRPIWLNTALSVLPYAILAVAGLVWSLAGRFKRQQLAVAAYLILVLLVAAPLYLLAMGAGMKIPVMKDYLAQRYLQQFRQKMPEGGVMGMPGGSTAPPPQHSTR